MALIHRKLIIVGAGGHGRETAMACQDSWNVPEIMGFLDDSGREVTQKVGPLLVHWKRQRNIKMSVL